MSRGCATVDCDRPHKARGYCGACYARLRRSGDLPLRTVHDRFWEKVDKTGDCWVWTGAWMGGGYGSVRHPDGHTVGAHRLSWELSQGRRPPDGAEVCHRCDNPPCVRPDHLFLGTRSDNQRDSAMKGRQAVQKLSVTDVLDIRRRASAGKMQRALAREFGVCEATVSHVVNLKTFRALKQAAHDLREEEPTEPRL